MARTRLNRDEYSGGAENSGNDPERLMHGRRRSRRLAGVSEKHKASEKAIQIEGSTDEEKEECSNTASYFDCNICFELAKEPVLTSCGHLFCWPCLYQWLHLHCGFEECPLCKGKVNESSILPIYGRGSSEDSVEKNNKNKNEEDGHQPSKILIPPRPQAHRVESLRQQLQGPLFRRSHGWVEDGGRTDAWFELEEQMEELFGERVQNHQRDVRRNPNPNPLVLPRNTLLSSPPLVLDGLNFLQDSSARISDVIAELHSLTSRREQRGEFRYLDPARRRDRDLHPSHSQASTSSTMAIIQGEVVDLDASRSPNRGGSSPMVLRRRGRSRASDSADVNGPQRNRRRVN